MAACATMIYMSLVKSGRELELIISGERRKSPNVSGVI